MDFVVFQEGGGFDRPEVEKTWTVMDLVVFEEGGGFNRPEVEKPCSLKSTKSFDYVTYQYTTEVLDGLSHF